MAALRVCSGESKSKFYSIWSKKCALYEKESIIQSLVNSNLKFKSCEKKKYLYAEYSNFWRTI